MRLATFEDVSVRAPQPIAEDQRPRVEAFIKDASALVTDYATLLVVDEDHPVPDLVRAVVCAEVILWLSISPGVSRSRVGEIETDYSGASSVQSLSTAAQRKLRRWRPQLGTVSLRRDRLAPDFQIEPDPASTS